MPLHMRLPKRGFNNVFRIEYAEINLGTLQAAVDAGKINGDSPSSTAPRWLPPASSATPARVSACSARAR